MLHWPLSSAHCVTWQENHQHFQLQIRLQVCNRILFFGVSTFCFYQPGLSTGHVSLGRIRKVNLLRRSLKENSLSILSFYVLNHGLVIASSKFLVVLVGLGIWSPPEDRRSDVISHIEPSRLLFCKYFRAKVKRRTWQFCGKLTISLIFKSHKSCQTVQKYARSEFTNNAPIHGFYDILYFVIQLFILTKFAFQHSCHEHFLCVLYIVLATI